MALARAVAAAAGAECVLYNVLRGDTIEAAVGWCVPVRRGDGRLRHEARGDGVSRGPAAVIGDGVTALDLVGRVQPRS